MKKIAEACMLIMFILCFSAMSNAAVSYAQDGIDIKLINGSTEKNITLTDSVTGYPTNLDDSQDVTIEVMDKELEVYFGHIADNNGYVSDTPSETNIFTVTPSANSVGERIVIRTNNAEYSLILKADSGLKPYSSLALTGDGDATYIVNVYGAETAFTDGNKHLYISGAKNEDIDVSDFENIYVGEREGVTYLSVYLRDNEYKYQDGKKQYDIDKTAVRTEFPVIIGFSVIMNNGGSGTTSSYLGDNIRVYNISGDEPELVYTQQELGFASLRLVDYRIGTFAVVYNKYAFSASFYDAVIDIAPVEDEEDMWTLGALYARIDNIDKYATELETDIGIPQKEGYTFVGWYNGIDGTRFRPLVEGEYICGRHVAKWIPNDEYIPPLKITLSGENEVILSGEEDGKKLRLTLSDGQWGDEFNEEDFTLTGCSDVSIGSIERIDDKNIVLTLLGNSPVKENREVSISFPRDFYCWGYNTNPLNRNGIVKNTLTSDNTITFYAERPIENGSHSALGKAAVSTNSLPSPDVPIETPAPSEIPDIPEPAVEMLFTVGSNIAVVNDENVTMDAAPFIDNERTLVPVRFIAEKLGMEVIWNEASQTVTLLMGDKEIILGINSNIAYVNGEKSELDTAAIIKNDRTFVPLRFVSETFNAKVDWDEETHTITVIK